MNTPYQCCVTFRHIFICQHAEFSNAAVNFKLFKNMCYLEKVNQISVDFTFFFVVKSCGAIFLTTVNLCSFHVHFFN